MSLTTPETTRLLALEIEVQELKKELQNLKENLLKKGMKKAERIDEIKDEVDRIALLSKFKVMPKELEEVIHSAKEWLMDNQDKGKQCGWTLRTSRVQKFLDKYPKKINENKPRII